MFWPCHAGGLAHVFSATVPLAARISNVSPSIAQSCLDAITNSPLAQSLYDTGQTFISDAASL